MRRLLLTTALAVAVFGLAGLMPATATAASGYCSGAGVNVAVDFGDLHGGVQKGCDTGGNGKSAWRVFVDAGFPLIPVQQQPGAACRVSGKPASAPCVRMPPTDAYWGLFSSTGGGWSYASIGAGGLTVHDGDTVAFAWQSSNRHRKPGTSPAPRHAASPAPTHAPTKSSTPHGQSASHPSHPSHSSTPRSSASPGGQSQAPSSAVPTAPATKAESSSTPRTHAKAHKKKRHAKPTPLASDSASPVAASVRPSAEQPASEDSGSGLPWWIPGGIVVLLAAAGGGVVLRRRSQ